MRRWTSGVCVQEEAARGRCRRHGSGKKVAQMWIKYSRLPGRTVDLEAGGHQAVGDALAHLAGGAKHEHLLVRHDEFVRGV